MRPWAARPRRRSLTELTGSRGVGTVPNVFRSAAVFTELSVFHSADARPVAAGGMFLSESRRSLLASVDLKKLTWTFPLMHRRLSHAFFKELQVLSKCLGVCCWFYFCSFVWLRKLHLIFVAWLQSLCWFSWVGGAELRMTQAPNFIYKICVCVSQSPDRELSVSLHPTTHSTNRNWSWRNTL